MEEGVGKVGQLHGCRGGLAVHLLPLLLPCPPWRDLECPLLLTKEVWLPRWTSLELTCLSLLVTTFCTCHLPPVIRLGHPHPKPRSPLVHPALHSLFLPQTHQGAPSKTCVWRHRTRASGGPCEFHPPRCLLVNRMWGCSWTTQSLAGDSTTLGKLRLLFIVPGFPSERLLLSLP